MSRYLIDRIKALPNVDLHVGAKSSRLLAIAPGSQR